MIMLKAWWDSIGGGRRETKKSIDKVSKFLFHKGVFFDEKIGLDYLQK